MRNHVKSAGLVTALLLSSLAAPAFATPAEDAAGTKAEAPAEEAVTVYRGATLIDGTGAAPRPGMAVVVKGDRIEAVLPAGDPAASPEGATIVDATGLYLLPGLIDSHVHLATPPDEVKAKATMRRELYSGITAVRDMADDLRALGELKRESLLGEIPGPDIYYAALMAGPDFFTDPRTIAVAQGAVPGEVPWMQAVGPDTDMKIAVAMARGTYATAVKAYAYLTSDDIHRITAEAHRQNTPVWAHGILFPATPAEVIDAGVDVISHVCYLGYQLTDPRPATYHDKTPVDLEPFENGDNPEMARLFGLMKEKGIILDATLRVYDEDTKRYEEAGEGEATPPRCPIGLAADLTSQAHRLGVSVIAGTDGDTEWDDPYPALHEELELLADDAKMPNLEVIRSATQLGAEALGHGDEMGTVEPGKLANLVLVEKDPVADISNLRSVALVVKRGKQFARSDYKPIREEEFTSAKDAE